MSRANPRTLATKWLAQSDAMTDEEHEVEDAKLAEARARTKAETPAERRERYGLRDSAPLYRDNRPFSIWADDGRDPGRAVVSERPREKAWQVGLRLLKEQAAKEEPETA